MVWRWSSWHLVSCCYQSGTARVQLVIRFIFPYVTEMTQSRLSGYQGIALCSQVICSHREHVPGPMSLPPVDIKELVSLLTRKSGTRLYMAGRKHYAPFLLPKSAFRLDTELPQSWLINTEATVQFLHRHVDTQSFQSVMDLCLSRYNIYRDTSDQSYHRPNTSHCKFFTNWITISRLQIYTMSK